MAPFAVLAPFIGPALDRMQQGRRYLLAGTLLARGLLGWGMSAAINSPVTLLPAAFGILVLQKSYGVVRASVTPRLLPAEITLVTANARSQLITLTASMLGGAVAAGIQASAGAAWVLRAGTLIYLAAMFLALRLPDQVDMPPAPAAPAAPTASTAPTAPPPAANGPSPGHYPNGNGRYDPGYRDDAGRANPAGTAAPSRTSPPPCRRERRRPAKAATATAAEEARPPRAVAGLANLGPIVGEAMRGNAVLRAFSGYMVFFLAFLLRSEHFGVSHNVALGALVAAAAGGGLAAMAIGSLLRARAPQFILFAMLTLAPIVTATCAWFFSLAAAIAVAFTAAWRRAGQAGARLHRAARDPRRDPVVGVRGLRDAEPGGERGGRPGRRPGLDAG